MRTTPTTEPLLDAPAADPKYARTEYERRWLLDADAVRRLSLRRDHKLLEDRYLACGPLRLRVVTDSETGQRIFKLTKKFPSPSPETRSIVTIRLSEREHDALRAMDGATLVKTRHYVEHLALTYAIDVFAGSLEGLILAEIEAHDADALAAAPAAPLAIREVTADSFFTGGSLSRVEPAELRERVARLR